VATISVTLTCQEACGLAPTEETIIGVRVIG